MISKRLILASVILFGSLWGLAELGVGELAWNLGIPRAAVLTAIGIIFLVLARRVWSVPGSSFALGALAAAFKFLQHPFWGCKVAAVLIVGLTFDVTFTFYEARRRISNHDITIGGVVAASAIATLASFLIFGPFARYVLHNPYWSMTGKMADYMFAQGLIATALAIPAAWVGLKLSERLSLSSERWTKANWLVYRLTAAGSGIAAVAAAVALKY
jgi:hypothetical protein